MINHKHKLIFIHIPRTGGTSIEKAILNNRSGWWGIHAPSKHLNASIAKKIYQPYWGDYFKFSFVRNPWDRMVSLLKYGKFYGVELGVEGELLIDKYLKKFNKVEYDTRFFNLKQFENFKQKPQSVYMNILGEEMDFIGRFENLQEDFNNVCDLIKVNSQKLENLEKSPQRGEYSSYYNHINKSIIKNKYLLDIEEFNYSF